MTQKNLLIALTTLIVAIFVFAQVYILFAVSQVSNQLVQMEARIDKKIDTLRLEMNQRLTDMENRIDKRLNLIETRLDALNQNYINQWC